MTTHAAGKTAGHRWPILSWLPGYQRSWLPLDFIGGLTVCAILIPEGMAYAQLAGVPPQAAFYAAPIGLLAYAVLGSSRQLVVAVSSAVAIMSAATISGIAPAGSTQYIALTAALAMLAGLISIAAGTLKLGRIAQFFSESVLVGFVFGLALLICIKQLPKILGVEAHGATAIALFRDTLAHLGQTNAVTLAVGVASIAAMILLERLLPRVPAALVVLIGSIAVSTAMGLTAHDVAVVGPLPAGLAGPKLPGVGLAAVPQLLAGAIGITLVAFAEAIGPANQFAREHGGKIDPNRELIALGAANTGAGLFQGFPIGSSLSKSAANDRAGAKTPASLVVAALATMLVALFLTPLFKSLPEASLGAIVIVAVSAMMNIGKMQQLWSLRRAEFWLAMAALVGVLVMPTLPALGTAVVLSLGMLIWRTSEGRLTFMGRGGGMHPVDLRTTPDATIPGLLIVRPDEMLFFANVASVRDAILQAIEDADQRPTVVLLDMELTPEVDLPVVDTLEDLFQRLDGRGIQLWLSHLQPDAGDLLDRAGALSTIGSDRVYGRVVEGILAFALRVPGSKERIAALNEVLAAVRDLKTRPGQSAEAVQLLSAFERWLSSELEASDEAGKRAAP